MSILKVTFGILAAHVTGCSWKVGWAKRNMAKGIFEYLIVNYRWILVILFVLPLSMIYDSYSYFRNKVIFYFKSAPKQHDKRVQNVQKQIREWVDSGSSVPMCTSRPGWQTMGLRVGKYKSTMRAIKLDMVDIVRLDVHEKFVRCEPLVTIGQLTSTLVPLGWTIPIVPELDDLTIGGMVNGTGIESSSHIYGLFQHICLAYEIILADGSVVRCTKDDNSDLFHAIPWSHGTLGFLASVDIMIIPCKPFIKLQYIPVTSQQEFVRIFLEESTRNNPHEFVETLVYSKDKAVVMLADMVDSADHEKLNVLSEYFKPWFFKHVESTFDTNERMIEYIPIRDYYHRHTRSLFWEIQDIVPFANNPIFRYTFGWTMPPKVSFLKLTQGETVRELYEKHHFVQDMLVPVKSLKKSLDFFHDTVKIYPIWLCPYNLPNNPGMVQPREAISEMYVDIGLYGNPGVKDFEAEKTTRKCEEFVRNQHGFQMLYADSYLTREEFRKMFDHTLYDKMRKKLNCKKAFPEVYDKISKAARH